MTIHVPYSPLPDIKSKIILAPIVPITLSYKKASFSTFALVDSGATKAVMSAVIAEALGIDWEKIPMSGGFSVGGTFRSHFIENVQAEIFDSQFPINMSIIEGISPFKCILGQSDLFKRAKITFEGYINEFQIDFREFN